MQIIKRPNLAEYSSIRIGGLGNFLYFPESEKELVSLLATDDDLTVIGGGTNIVFADMFADNVICLSRLGVRGLEISEAVMSVEAGVKLSRIVYTGVRAGFSGLESLAGIPGTLGGAIVMNAGSRYGCIADFIRRVRVFSRADKKVLTIDSDSLGFGYRCSSFQENSDWIVLGAELAFSSLVDASELKKRVSQTINERIVSKIKLPNCGSVFKNPVHELSAGAMIDKLGFKGYASGSIVVSTVHANIFVNIQPSIESYADFCNLVDFIKNKVYAEYGVELELEIRIIQ